MLHPRGDILIVDDDMTVVHLLVDALSEAGYSVCVAYDGASALLAMERDRPALVLLDLHMPEVNGREVLAQRWWYGLTEIPVIVMTSDVHAAQKLLANGLAECILKPFTLETLLARVAHYLPKASEAEPMECTG